MPDPFPLLGRQPDGGDHWGYNADGVLIRDTPCRRCAYNLRGLSRHSLCPECGTSVEWSAHGNRLMSSDARWLDQTANALNFISLGTYALAPLFIGMLAVAPLMGVASAFCTVLFGPVPLLAIAMGAWYAAIREPIAESPITTRRLARFSRLGALACPIFCTNFVIVAFMWRSSYPWIPAPSTAAVRIVTSAVQFGPAAAVTAFLYYCAELANRVPNLDLAAKLRRLAVLPWLATAFYMLPYLADTARDTMMASLNVEIFGAKGNWVQQLVVRYSGLQALVSFGLLYLIFRLANHISALASDVRRCEQAAIRLSRRATARTAQQSTGDAP